MLFIKFSATKIIVAVGLISKKGSFLKMLNKNSIHIEIELMRNEMYKSAKENGLNSVITINISQELDKLLNSLHIQKNNK
jgi:5,10-methylenetetrahydrofolate reductase